MLRKDPSFTVPEPAAVPGRGAYANPVFPDFPDPCVTYDAKNGYYYCTRSHNAAGRCGVSVSRGRTLTALMRETVPVFYTDPSIGLYGGVWASEIHRVGEKWYIYASASCHPKQQYMERKMRTFTLESRTDDPFDGFDFAGVLGQDEAAIDATVLQYRNGKLYLCFSRCLEQDAQKLMVQEMASPTRLRGAPVCVARATYPWEMTPPYTGNRRINEGPFFFDHAGRTFCVYSFNGCWSDAYGLGVMELMGDDPMNAGAWVKDDRPWLTQTLDLHAPGHASFFRSPDGKELYIAYHAVTERNPQNSEMPRHCCVQKVYFDKTGFPHAGKPVRRGRPIPLPGGDNGEGS